MMNTKTGRSIGIAAHINQSIDDILWTKYGTRVQREEYGSLVPELVDQPASEIIMLQIASSIYMALATWEPRIKVTNVLVNFENDTDTGAIITVQWALNGMNGEFIWGRNRHE